MKWVVDALNFNAKVFKILSDVETINKRIEKTDEEVKNLGRELAELKGFLMALKFNNASEENTKKMDEVQGKIDAIFSRLLIGSENDAIDK